MGKKTDKFRKDHESLLKMIGDLSQFLIIENLAKEPQNAVRAIGKLSGALKMHWANEERTLYPDMLKNTKAKSVAETFQKEMTPIKMAFDGYYSKWLLVTNIQKDNKGFVNDTKKLIESLKTRFEKEDSELYETADQHAA